MCCTAVGVAMHTGIPVYIVNSFDLWLGFPQQVGYYLYMANTGGYDNASRNCRPLELTGVLTGIAACNTLQALHGIGVHLCGASSRLHAYAAQLALATLEGLCILLTFVFTGMAFFPHIEECWLAAVSMVLNTLQVTAVFAKWGLFVFAVTVLPSPSAYPVPDIIALASKKHIKKQ